MGKDNGFQPNTLPLKVRTPGIIKLVSDQLIAALAEQHVINIRVRGFNVIGCFDHNYHIIKTKNLLEYENKRKIFIIGERGVGCVKENKYYSGNIH